MLTSIGFNCCFIVSAYRTEYGLKYGSKDNIVAFSINYDYHISSIYTSISFNLKKKTNKQIDH